MKYQISSPRSKDASGYETSAVNPPEAATDRCSPATIGSQTSSSSAKSDVSASSMWSLQIHPPSRTKEPGQVHRTGLWRPNDIREPMVLLHAEHLAEHGWFSPKGGDDG